MVLEVSHGEYYYTLSSFLIPHSFYFLFFSKKNEWRNEWKRKRKKDITPFKGTVLRKTGIFWKGNRGGEAGKDVTLGWCQRVFTSAPLSLANPVTQKHDNREKRKGISSILKRQWSQLGRVKSLHSRLNRWWIAVSRTSPLWPETLHSTSLNQGPGTTSENSLAIALTWLATLRVFLPPHSNLHPHPFPPPLPSPIPLPPLSCLPCYTPPLLIYPSPRLTVYIPTIVLATGNYEPP